MEAGSSRVSRRAVLAAGAGVPLGVGLLAACGEDEPTPTTTTTTEESPTAESPTAESPTAAGSDSLAAVADIPVGGALLVEKGPDGKPVVLSRPSEDEVIAFSAICTHKGCTVVAEDSQISCPCHGSTYDFTGNNTGGPAPAPLPKVDVSVEGGEVVPG